MARVSGAYCLVQRLSTARRFPTLSRPQIPSITSSPQLWNSPKLPSFRTYSSLNAMPIAQVSAREIAFAFDIDGVLLRSSAPIPGASDALRILQDQKIPFIILTNGGGSHESERVSDLSNKLGVPLSEENLIQSHTPFKELVEGSSRSEALKYKNILVTGGHAEKCRGVALRYGFENVITPADILMAQSKLWPFNQVFSDFYKSSGRPLPAPIDSQNLTQSLKIDAIFVLSSPRDWALDTQIILDLLLSQEGYLGTYSTKNGDQSLPNCGWQQDGQPLLYFSNPDLVWATDYHLPRLGQGGFQAAFQGVWSAITSNARLTRSIIGKPHQLTYEYAERVLIRHRQDLLSPDAPKIKRVYMVGDNSESDIRGANEFKSPSGVEWHSFLVSTGVHKKGTVPIYKPNKYAVDVLDAVQQALASESETVDFADK